MRRFKNKNLAYILICMTMVISLCGCSKNNKVMNNDNGEKDNYINVSLNEEIILEDIAEITFNQVGYTEEILPPNTTGSVYKYEDNKEEKYILLKGTYKNLLTKKFDDYENFNGLLKINNKYDYKTVIIVFANNDDNNFWERPDSLQTMNMYIWVTVPNDVISDNNSYDFYLDFIDDQKEKTESLRLNFEMTDINNSSQEKTDNDVEIDYSEVVSNVLTLDYDLLNKEQLGNLSISSVDLGDDKVVIRGRQEELDKVISVKAVINLKDNKLVLGGQQINDIVIVAYDSKGQSINNVDIVPSTCSAYITTQE